MSKFKYLIFPDHTYVISDNEFSIEVLGKEIIEKIKLDYLSSQAQDMDMSPGRDSNSE